MSQQNLKLTYLMYNPENQLVKIGRSSNPIQRLRQVSKDECASLSLKYIINADIEDFLHHVFAKKRVKGEWFDVSATEVVEFVEKNFTLSEDERMTEIPFDKLTQGKMVRLPNDYDKNNLEFLVDYMSLKNKVRYVFNKRKSSIYMDYA